MGVADDTVLAEYYSLLDKIPKARLSSAMSDLSFDWSNPAALTKGQLKVTMKRMRRAAKKTFADYEIQARDSELVRSMRASLEQFREGLKHGS